MARKSTSDIIAILDSEKAAALSADSANSLSTQRQDAMDCYQGKMQKWFPDDPSHSTAVSSDVADTIDGMVPDIIDMLAGSDEVVRFDPVGPGDVEAAQQETDYVNHVFWQENPGFLVLFSYIKDALLQKTGTMKVSWESKEEETEEMYFDLPDDEFVLLVNNPDVRVIQHTIKPAPGDGPDNIPETDQAYN